MWSSTRRTSTRKTRARATRTNSESAAVDRVPLKKIGHEFVPDFAPVGALICSVLTGLPAVFLNEGFDAFAFIFTRAFVHHDTLAVFHHAERWQVVAQRAQFAARA